MLGQTRVRIEQKQAYKFPINSNKNTTSQRDDLKDKVRTRRDGMTTRSNDQMRGWKDNQKNTNGPSEKSRSLEAQHFTEQKSQVCSHSTEIKKAWRREAEKISSNGNQHATGTGEMNEQSTNMRSTGGEGGDNQQGTAKPDGQEMA